ncbi:DUF3888 domain-containing protein [Paenibacillus sp. tmac-D7]|uniref:DUF3888 domain-containing protein n=1 Tax=Paenibacillus sp. tmac-D7 TaxID=2591462 RepID=UPI0015E8744C|nr:DUF3888 domain-containing protein [Paenibacillus sp. tmac-D7]
MAIISPNRVKGEFTIIKRVVLGLTSGFLLLAATLSVSADEPSSPTKEQLLEETLIVRYLPLLMQSVREPFYCERVLQIRQLNRSNREHEVTVGVVTFQGPHNPPHDLVEVTLTDVPGDEGVRVRRVERTANAPIERIRRHCSPEGVPALVSLEPNAAAGRLAVFFDQRQLADVRGH